MAEFRNKYPNETTDIDAALEAGRGLQQAAGAARQQRSPPL